MARSLEEIEQEVKAWPAAKRLQFLRDLIADLNGEVEHEADVERAWLEEATRRQNELRDGRTQPVAAEDVISKAKDRLRNKG